MDLSLGLYFAFWYLGNSFYNIQNKKALNSTGGKTAGLGMTVATLQLGVGAAGGQHDERRPLRARGLARAGLAGHDGHAVAAALERAFAEVPLHVVDIDDVHAVRRVGEGVERGVAVGLEALGGGHAGAALRYVSTWWP